MSSDGEEEESEDMGDYGDFGGEGLTSGSVGRAPQCTFGIRWSQTAFISKKHSEAEPGLDSPGVGDYKLRVELDNPTRGKHFGTATKELLPTRYEGPASSKSRPSHASPGPKYNAMPTEYRAVPTWKIGTSKRPPLSMPSKGPGPGAYSPNQAPSTVPPEFSFGNSPDQDRFAQNMYSGALASKAIPVLDTPGPVYQLRTRTDSDGWTAPFEHADRFEPLKHLMISDEHNKRMGESANDYPAANAYMTATFPPPKNQPVRRNPPTMKPAKDGVYNPGTGQRFTDVQYGGKGALVGLGKEGGGPGSADVKDVTLRKNAPKFPRSARNVGSKSTVSQVPGPGAYKPPLKVGCDYQGKGINMGLNRSPPAHSTKTPAPNTYMLVEEPGSTKPMRGIGKGSRHPKVYLSKKHTQDIKGLDSPGPVYHYQVEKDFGTGHSALIGTADRNKSEAKRFISKMHSADILGVDTPGPGTYGSSADDKIGGGYSFGTAERKTGNYSNSRTPGPGSYTKPSTLRTVGCSFGGGPSRC